MNVGKLFGFAVALVAVVALMAATAAQSRGRAPTVINLGWVGDETGPTASSQLPSLHGLQTAFAYVNAHGGIGPHHDTINVIAKDDGYNPTTELSLVKSATRVSFDELVARRNGARTA